MSCPAESVGACASHPEVVVGPVQSVDEDRLGRTRRPDGVDERLHPGGVPRDRGGVPGGRTVWADLTGGDELVQRAAVQPALPRVLRRIREVAAVEEGLVEEIEDHGRVAREVGGHRLPEGDGVVRVGHRLLGHRRVVTRRAPMQVQDGDHAGLIDQAHLGRDGGLVVGPAVGRVDPVDSQPAVLVERDPNHVDVPGLHRLVGAELAQRLVAVDVPAAVGRSSPLVTGELGAGEVDTVQGNGVPRAVDEMIARDVNRERRGGETRARGLHQEEGCRHDRAGADRAPPAAAMERGHERVHGGLLVPDAVADLLPLTTGCSRGTLAPVGLAGAKCASARFANVTESPQFGCTGAT